MTNHLDRAIFQDEAKAREWLEARIWPTGPVCPHCGSLTATQLHGKAHRAGVYQCNDCREQFTVTVNTVFERSKIPLTKWLMALYLMMSSKKGMSAHQMHRMIGVSYKSTWFMMHRLREALREGTFTGPLGGANQVVEVDETYVGGKAANQKGKVPAKEAVVTLVERDGRARSFHVAQVTSANVKTILATQLDKGSYLMTDGSTVYPPIAAEVASGHGTVNHSIEEYVRGGFWHTNTVESYFSVFKRGIMGTFHHVSQQHLKRYLCEFDFRHNERSALGVNDVERFDRAIVGIKGKRLTYRRPCGEAGGGEA